jgi:hypothetical protein
VLRGWWIDLVTALLPPMPLLRYLSVPCEQGVDCISDCTSVLRGWWIDLVTCKHGACPDALLEI